MADFDNLSEINENFDTIKTLLNSIRAQGILNTSDVDKLLSGINSKLEKINTDEDLDLIKIFLSDLKQNLDERHSVLVSKFGAIESLFSNLLKNSAEMLKSSEVKELFDIVATNLSVFSREVVSQKETLTDITLRLDALRSDDSAKKDIIKNIAVLKPDLDRLNNGFDSIVLSLNDNFKTIIKTIATIDKTEYLDRFSDNLSSIEMASNTLLSALQMLDKKFEQFGEAFSSLTQKEDLNTTNKAIFELISQSQEILSSVHRLGDSYFKIDNLADKIDASVNIIAGLKSVLEESDNEQTKIVLDKIQVLEDEVKTISTDTKFDDFKVALGGVLKEILELSTSIGTGIEGLDNSLKAYVEEALGKVSLLNDANITRVLNDISTSADALNTKLSQTQSAISVLCEKNFNSVFENISDLKSVVAQIDENGISANNAIFSSITDRLSLFETNLRNSLNNQEKSVAESSGKLVEQIDNIKNLSTVLDYKMDSSIVEVGNVKREFESLKGAVENVLALDFVNTVNDFRLDLYASKQELINSIENNNNELNEKFTNDLYGKYELLISKLDSVEEEFKQTLGSSLNGLKSVLENISSSIVDIRSYVSERPAPVEYDSKISDISDIVKENNLNYVENVRDIVDVIRVQVENNLKSLDTEFDSVKRAVSENSEDLKKEIKYSYSKLLEIQDSYNEIKEIINVNSISNTDKFDGILSSTESVKSEFDTKLGGLKNALLDKISEFKQEFTCENADKVSELKFSVESLYNKSSQDIVDLVAQLKDLVANFTSEGANSRTAALAKILDNFVAVKELINTLNDKSTEELGKKVDVILEDFDSLKVILNRVDGNIDSDMTRQLSIIESNFESLVSQVTILFDKSDKSLTDKINEEFEQVSDRMQETISEKLEGYKLTIEKVFEGLENKANSQSEYLQERIADLNDSMKSTMEKQAEENNLKIQSVAEKLKEILDENIELTSVDYNSLKAQLADFAKDLAAKNSVLTQDLKAQLDDITKYIDSVLDIQTQEAAVKAEEFSAKLDVMANNLAEKTTSIKNDVFEGFGDITKFVASVQDIQAKDANEKQAAIIEAINNQSDNISNKIGDLKIDLQLENNNVVEHVNSSLKLNTEQVEVGISNILNNINLTKEDILADIKASVEEKAGMLKTLTAEVSAGELQTIDLYVNNILEQIEVSKSNVQLCKDMITEFLKKELGLISKNVEAETDVIIGELVEQFDLLKKSQADDVISLTTRIEEIVNDHIYTNIEDLKSYLDIKTDSSVLSSKLDNLKIEMTSSVDNVLSGMSKLLDGGVFNSALADFRLANELLVSSTIDNLNDKIENFICENIKTIADVLDNNAKDFENKLNIFDKHFAETIVDKFEEVKLISNRYNDSFASIEDSINEVLRQFEDVKSSIDNKIENLIENIKVSVESSNEEIRNLNNCFENLRSQISNKSFDEAFQASINKQIASLESLINEQLGYVEDISDVCMSNLPDVVELNALVKGAVIESLHQLSEKLDSQDLEGAVSAELREFKSDIITQFLNVFNQISFVAEQEEILDFIQEKHSELITILSHIVTTSDEIVDVKDNLTVVDNKIELLKDDIESINGKINSIISAEGDIDYVYSLQDLESDIANLRLVLNEMKENNHSEEFEGLISSTDAIYKLVESIKTELPNKLDMEGIAEDIVSISTRTNKLLLASDESYKTLQDNLHEFKLVIDDLDERTRNFAQDSGLNKIENKINALNSMMKSGEKTNQVFNQVFEYLAEWVDNASVQINSISDKVETLDEIAQIKDMLVDLKSEAEDDSQSLELVEALGQVFDKQTKKILSLEAKLDKIIVETTISNRNHKLDLAPIEETFNRFLVAVEEKMTSQQEKINSLEEKLESLLEEKNTAQLTKKVGGMDRQIAKLNKSIEKIASYVVEK